MAITPPPTWPIEPTILYVVSYYTDAQTNTAPTILANNLRDYPSAVAKAKELITDAGNTGVCIISNQTATIVYPSIPWVAF